MAVPTDWKKQKAGDLNTELKPNVGCYIEIDLFMFFLPHTWNTCYYKRHKCKHPFELMIGKVFFFFPLLQNLQFTLHMRRHTAHLQHAAVIWSWKIQYSLENDHVYKHYFWTIVIQGTAFSFPFRFMIIEMALPVQIFSLSVLAFLWSNLIFCWSNPKINKSKTSHGKNFYDTRLVRFPKH